MDHPNRHSAYGFPGVGHPRNCKTCKRLEKARDQYFQTVEVITSARWDITNPYQQGLLRRTANTGILSAL